MAELSAKSAMEIVVWAGKILMESGAEIYRIEDTLSLMAQSLGIADFSAYVVNRGILASGLDKQGQSVVKNLTVKGISFDLGKLEAVNALSRQIVSGHLQDLIVIKARLQAIENRPSPTFFIQVQAYFFGAFGFTYALGSSLMDAWIAGLTGVVLYLFHSLVARKIQTDFILTIFESAWVALVASLLVSLGLGQQLDVIILGTLMILIPGAFFVNAIREFSQNNYATGLALIMSALLTCVSISVGVMAMIELVPFAGQLKGNFATQYGTAWSLLARMLTAGLGTLAFSVLYRVPSSYLFQAGVLGSLSWGLYLYIEDTTSLDALAVLLASLFVAFFSRYLAVWKKCPSTIFLATSIFPLIPGLSFYRAVYFMLIGDKSLAYQYMQTSFITAFMIALAIGLVRQLHLTPSQLFSRYFINK